MPVAAEFGQEPQSARAVLMVRPASFGFNPQTAATNAFQKTPDSTGEFDQQGLALLEFDALADLSGREIGLSGVFALAIVVLGVRPMLVLNVADSALRALARVVGGGA